MLSSLHKKHLCLIVLSGLVVLIPGYFLVLGGDQPRPGYLDRDTRKALIPGLQVTFTVKKDGRTLRDTRTDRLAALFVPEGHRATPFLPPGPFHATWKGYVKNRLRDEFIFRFKGQGKATLYLNKKQVLIAGPGDLAEAKPVKVELAKGYNHFRLEYDSPVSADAKMRLYWSGETFPLEPVQVNAFLCDGRDATLQTGERLREGRHLFARLHCQKCHAESDKVRPTNDSMPELKRDAPSLANAGARLQANWVAHWVQFPAVVRNRTSMPKMLAHLPVEKASKAAIDLAAYVSSLGKANGKMPEPKLAETGAKLFEFRGCLACHRFTEPKAEDAYDRVSLFYVNEKYQPGAVAEYLTDTHKHYRWNPMPKFQLNPQEAGALAAFIRREASGKLLQHQVGDVAKGKQAFAEFGCNNCHAVDDKGVQRMIKADDPFAAMPDKGCLAKTADGRGKAPFFSLKDEQRSALQAFLKTDAESLAALVPAEFSRRQVKQLNCTACHQRDTSYAKLVNVIADEGYTGLTPDPIPPLTWVGEKLHPQWSEQLLAGKLKYRLRSHFKTHMPAFPEQAKLLAIGLSHEHGFSSTEKQTIPWNKQAAEVGKTITVSNKGFACNRCHAIGSKPATAPEQALSTNLSYARQRLRYEYYTRWMLHPQRVNPTTAMIQFAPDSRTTPLKTFYNGNARQQFDAVWHYLKVLDDDNRNAPK